MGRVRKARDQLEALRRRMGQVRPAEVARIAAVVGRRRFNRGKEPTYVADDRPEWRPLSIPNHSGTLKFGTARNILDQLDRDLTELEMENEEDGGGSEEER